jgi:hypothetical protein
VNQRAALVALGAALAAAAAVLLSYASGLTYFQDSWEFLMQRRDLTVDALFQPHNEHIVVFPVLIQQALLRLFGMGSVMPDFVVLTAFLLVTAVLVFVYVRRRLGPWPALFAAVVLLFLGPAWQDLLWPFQVGFVGSALFGVAMLLALDEDDGRWDAAACGFLVLSIGFSSLGVAFAAAAVVNVLQRLRSRGWRRAYVAVVPLALYAAWYAGWGHEAESHVSSHNVFASPGYVVEGLSASVDSALALATILGEAVGRSDWGLPLLIAFVLLLGYGLFRGRRPDPGVWPVLAATAAFWFLAAFSTIPGREAWSSRYLYVGVLFLLLLAADLLKGVRIRWWALAVAGVLAGVVVGFNLEPLREGRDFFKTETELTRADLGAVEIASRTVEPGFALPPEVSGTPFLNEIRAAEYLQAVREYGSPAYTPAELAQAPEDDRAQADLVLANALPLAIEAGAPPAGASGRCIQVPGADASNPAPPLSLSAGTTTVEIGAGGPGAIRLRRFARAGYPLATEGLAPGSTTSLQIPADSAPQPWLLEVEAPAGATVCRQPS